MYVLILRAALIAILDLPPSSAERGEMTAPPVGTWRVQEIVDGPASGRDGTTVRITGARLVITGGAEKEEFLAALVQAERRW